MKIYHPDVSHSSLKISISLLIILLAVASALGKEKCTLELPEQCSCILSNQNHPNRLRRETINKTKESFLARVPIKREHVTVECNLKESPRAAFVQVASALHRRLIDKLTLNGLPMDVEASVTRLPSGWLNTTRIRQLQITDTFLANDFLNYGKPFAGQEHSMIWFSFKNCYLTGSLSNQTKGSVAMGTLKNFHRLLGLDLSFNHIEQIEKDAFTEPPKSLSTLILNHNDIHNVEPGAFSDMTRLGKLDLSYNKMWKISREVFAPTMKQLRSINLSWNRLEEIPEGFFENMPALQEIDVSYNFLYSFPEQPWKKVWGKMQILELEGNFFECDCDLLWLFDGNKTSISTDPPVTGQCLRSSQIVYTFDLQGLTKDKLDCEESGSFYASGGEKKSVKLPVGSTMPTMPPQMVGLEDGSSDSNNPGREKGRSSVLNDSDGETTDSSVLKVIPRKFSDLEIPRFGPEKKVSSVLIDSGAEKKESSFLIDPGAEKKEPSVLIDPGVEKKEPSVLIDPGAEKKEPSVLIDPGAEKKDSLVLKDSGVERKDSFNLNRSGENSTQTLIDEEYVEDLNEFQIDDGRIEREG